MFLRWNFPSLILPVFQEKWAKESALLDALTWALWGEGKKRGASKKKSR